MRGLYEHTLSSTFMTTIAAITPDQPQRESCKAIQKMRVLAFQRDAIAPPSGPNRLTTTARDLEAD